MAGVYLQGLLADGNIIFPTLKCFTRHSLRTSGAPLVPVGVAGQRAQNNIAVAFAARELSLEGEGGHARRPDTAGVLRSTELDPGHRAPPEPTLEWGKFPFFLSIGVPF